MLPLTSSCCCHLENTKYRTSFDLISYLEKPELTWLQKICLVLHIAAYFCLVYVLGNYFWEYYHNHTVLYDVDVAYESWNISFPAVSVCEAFEQNDLEKISNSWFQSGAWSPQVAHFLKGVLRRENYYCADCERQCEIGANCPKDKYIDIVNMLTKSCYEIFDKCTWNDYEFECCDNFYRLITKNGVCYSMGSLQTSFRSPMIDEMVVTHYKPEGMLELHMRVPVEVFVHAEEEIGFATASKLPFPFNEKKILKPGQELQVKFSKKDTTLKGNVRALDPEGRRCKFTEENENVWAYPRYSYSACTLECKSTYMLRFCNCTHHLIPNTDPRQMCDYRGLKCLDYYFKRNDTVSEKRNKGRRKNCMKQCLLDCMQAEIKVVWSDFANLTTDEYSVAKISFYQLPTERYQMRVGAQFLDLFILVAGLSRCVTRVSLMDVFEFIHFVTCKILYRNAVITYEFVCDEDDAYLMDDSDSDDSDEEKQSIKFLE